MGRVIVVAVVALVVLGFLSPNSEQGGQLLYEKVIKYPRSVEASGTMSGISTALPRYLSDTLSSVQTRVL